LAGALDSDLAWPVDHHLRRGGIAEPGREVGKEEAEGALARDHRATSR
jgi:hypothetical protein